jgi:hypothetical protein
MDERRRKWTGDWELWWKKGEILWMIIVGRQKAGWERERGGRRGTKRTLGTRQNAAHLSFVAVHCCRGVFELWWVLSCRASLLQIAYSLSEESRTSFRLLKKFSQFSESKFCSDLYLI